LKAFHVIVSTLTISSGQLQNNLGVAITFLFYNETAPPWNDVFTIRGISAVYLPDGSDILVTFDKHWCTRQISSCTLPISAPHNNNYKNVPLTNFKKLAST